MLYNLSNWLSALNKTLLSLSGSNNGTSTYHSIHSKCSLFDFPFLAAGILFPELQNMTVHLTHCTLSVISVALLHGAFTFPMSHLTAIDSCFSVIICLQHFWSCKVSLQGICFFPILSSGFLHISITCMHIVLEIFHCITQHCSAVSDANREISFCHFRPDRHVSQMVLILPVSHTTLDMMLSCLCSKLQTVNCEDTATLFQYWTFWSDKLGHIVEAEVISTKKWYWQYNLHGPSFL